MPALENWYKNAIFYELYVRAFADSDGDSHGDLAGVTARLDYLQWLGVTCLWLLPIYPSPLRDDGYDIADYYNIHPTYGQMEDFRTLVEEAHRRGMRVIADLVLNHISDQHPWFQSARADRNSPYRDYFVWSDTDQKYKDARIIFLDVEPSNWTFDETAGQYYWHRFYASQPDLNFENPKVRQEMLQVMKFWLESGIDGFRADAVPYLFERDGTNCENLPETHVYLKEVRRAMDESHPGRILLAEANQWPQDVRAYFGDGDEFNMAFHFPLMPRIYMALRKEDTTPIRWALDNTPPIPTGCQWCTFLRNHDELTLEMVSEEERQWMWKEYAPEPRMKQNLGIRRRLAPLMDNDPRKIRLLNSLLFSLPGAPIIYYGDEIGMGDNIWLPDRNGVRTPMQWNGSAPNGGFSAAPAEMLYSPVISEAPYSPEQVNVAAQQNDPASLLSFMRHLIHLRKLHPALADAPIRWVETGNPAVLAFTRGEGFTAVHNFSDVEHTVRITAGANLTNLLEPGQQFASAGGKLELRLQAYQTLWLAAG